MVYACSFFGVRLCNWRLPVSMRFGLVRVKGEDNAHSYCVKKINSHESLLAHEIEDFIVQHIVVKEKRNSS